MRRVVVDASVVVKWIFPDRAEESNTAEALGLLDDIRGGKVAVVQPAHWLAEVAAVAVRIEPAIAREAVELLWTMEFAVADSAETYRTAVELASQLGQHLFDTLYHAVALETPAAHLVTADRRYYEKAKGRGRLLMLEGYRDL